ncbi:MAG TPA: lipid-binding SYLF domain-containing protein [Terriglobia bacterium]|nr:lipid-binding SYLF domain-containing protein [Terriglobia bacterium]
MKKWPFMTLMAILAGLTWMATARAQTKPDDRLQRAALVMNAILQAPDNGIPQDLLDRAVCVGVIPSAKKLAFGLGATYGRGALVCREGGNGPWGAPSMILLSGASYGLQLGGQATDLVFIVMSAKAAERIMQSSLKLGVDVSAAAGPVGRHTEAATNAHFNVGILSYSRSRGLFAGLSLSGAALKEDAKANRQLYRRSLEPKEILLSGKVAPPASAKPLDGILEKYSPHGGEPAAKTTSRRVSSTPHGAH